MSDKAAPSGTGASKATGTTRRATGTRTRSTAGPVAAGAAPAAGPTRTATRSGGTPKKAPAAAATKATAAAGSRPTRAAGGAAPLRRARSGNAGPTSAGAAVSAARARSTSGLDRSGTAHGHSAVEALLATHVADAIHERATTPVAAPPRPTPSSRTRPARVEAPPQAPLPPAQDVLLGAVSLMGEHAWRWGTQAVAAASEVTARTVAFVRGVAPGYASAQVESRLNALAERGQRVRQERTEAISTAVSTAITSAATSDAVREMTVAAIEEATDDVLAVMLPAVLEAVSELETQERLDELMAGLLLRQLPSALEKTLPGVMIRTATRPALGLVPFLGGSAPRGQ